MNTQLHVKLSSTVCFFLSCCFVELFAGGREIRFQSWTSLKSTAGWNRKPLHGKSFHHVLFSDRPSCCMRLDGFPCELYCCLDKSFFPFLIIDTMQLDIVVTNAEVKLSN